MSRGTIKILALCAMICNHIAYLFLIPDTIPYGVLTAIGYFTAPCMCFFLAEGFDKTSDRKRYLARLLFWACLSQPVYSIAFGGGLNMLFTLATCLLVLCVTVQVKNKVLCDIVCAGLIFATAWMDWPVLAPVFTLLFYYETGFLPFIGCYLFYVFLSMFLMGNGTVSFLYGLPILTAGVVLVFIYNEKKGNVPNWFFYLFYPSHLAVLYGIKLLLG